MLATANPSDPLALTDLNFLCNGVGSALSEFAAVNAWTFVDPAVQSAVNQSCAAYSMVLSGHDPSGMPANFVNYVSSSAYLDGKPPCLVRSAMLVIW